MDSTSATQLRRSESWRGVNAAVATVGRRSSSSQTLLQSTYGPIIEPLHRVEQRLNLELQSEHASLSQVLRHGTQLGGKRLRPAMLLLAASATGELTDDHVLLATVVEMVHTATLVHDDVLDEADTRRRVPTVNAKWNDHTSILLGDYLFAQSFYLAATLPSTEACRWIGEAARRVCEGELRQVLQRDELELDEETYIDLIRGKTAELCSVACRLGAKFAGADDSIVAALGLFGDAIGIAFQIADDYLDLWGDDRTVGKTLGTDIRQGKMTLPIIRLLQTASPRDRNEIVDILEGPPENRLMRIRPFLENSDARQHTRQVAHSYRDRSIESLNRLDPSPALASLKAMAEFSVNRSF